MVVPENDPVDGQNVVVPVNVIVVVVAPPTELVGVTEADTVPDEEAEVVEALVLITEEDDCVVEGVHSVAGRVKLGSA